jgi:fido (protein-threonine AMPylation protein)
MPEIPRATTESQLREWRSGQAGSERLAAAILQLEGFSNIDPQAPLGGPDDRKDILCEKGKVLYVAGVYFPTTDKSLSDIKSKFQNDIEGAIRHERTGIAFITNQTISVEGRKQLEEISHQHGRLCELYHRERIRAVLDSPTGYGVRLEHLRIPMNESEQLAYFASSSKQIEYAIERNTREIQTLSKKIEIMHSGQMLVASTMRLLATTMGKTVILPSKTALTQPTENASTTPPRELLSASLSLPLILLIHRLSCYDMPFAIVGKLRYIDVWISTAGLEGAANNSPFPPHSEVKDRLLSLIKQWNDDFIRISRINPVDTIQYIAKFHHQFINIHPFVDGNGRAARAITIQQCLDIFGKIEPFIFSETTDYYNAIQSNSSGEAIEKLTELIRKAVS